MISMVLAGTPYVYAKTATQELDKNYVIDAIKDKTVITKHDSVVGFIQKDTLRNYISINIDLIAPAKEKESTMFNYTSRIAKLTATENYSLSDNSEIEKDMLINRKEYRKIYFKHKKDKQYTEIDAWHEFYVLNKEYIPKSEIKEIGLSSNFGLIEKSDFTEKYWEKIEDFSIPKLPDEIQKLLGKDLKMYK